MSEMRPVYFAGDPPGLYPQGTPPPPPDFLAIFLCCMKLARGGCRKVVKG